MKPQEIVKIRNVTVEKIATDDKTMGEIFGYSKRQMTDRRREMTILPSMRKYVLDGGSRVTIEGMKHYLTYRRSLEWEREMAKAKRLLKKS